MNKLFNLSTVYKSSDIFKLKRLYEEIETNTRALSALGLDEKQYGAMLIPIILKTIPRDLTLEWNRKNALNVHNTSIQELLAFLHTEIFSREHTFLFPKRIASEVNKSSSNYRSLDTRATKTSSTQEFVASATMNEITNKKCIFCKENSHRSELCEKFDVENRKNILKKEGRCFLCLTPKHRIKDCTKNLKC